MSATREVIDDARRLSREEFVRKHAAPVLLIPPINEGDPTFETAARIVVERDGRPIAVLAFDVVALRKRGVNPFRNMITLGRGPTNDIEVRSGQVSKFHAYFTLEKGRVLLTDSASTNGTTVYGRRLAPNDERAPLSPGDDLSFGGVRAVFHEPDSLWTFLRSVPPPEAGPGSRASPRNP